jgi:alpha-methylacyl-CoA racemase
MTGPLSDLRVLELAALGPVPHSAMVLADLGADVVRIDRPGASPMAELAGSVDHVLRGRRTTTLNLKSAAGLQDLRELCRSADVLLEGFRPGVLERMGLGPQELQELNPRLVLGRMTGWGREGPLAMSAGHDLNYLAATGVLHAVGQADRPPPVPLTLLGDYGGGSMVLVTGLLAALWERERSGHGQVVDTAMVDGIGIIAQKMWAMRGAGTWSEERQSNLLDGGAPFYDTYTCSDGRYLAIGAIERNFFAILLANLEIDPDTIGDQYDRAAWPGIREQITAAVAGRSRDAWAHIFEGSDACATPVLTFSEALKDVHACSRSAYVELEGVAQPAPAPRFSRSATATPVPPGTRPVTVSDVLSGWVR